MCIIAFMKFLLSLLAFFLAIAGGAQTRYTFTHPQMGTEFRLVFYTDADSVALLGLRAFGKAWRLLRDRAEARA